MSLALTETYKSCDILLDSSSPSSALLLSSPCDRLPQHPYRIKLRHIYSKMCVGENCALQDVYYINAQLAALYDNAVSCVENHHNAHRTEDRFRYSHALADFSYGETYGHYKFQANFGKPELEFICNHDALLRIKINLGHYHLDHRYEGVVESTHNEPLHDLEAVFRVSFVRKTISGRDSQIGSGQNLIQLVVFDLTKPKLVSFQPAITNGRDALVFYLEKYLEFLQNAGTHVLFSLPDFDDDRYRLTIDYSLMRSTVKSLDSFHGISLRELNDDLVSGWLKATMLASEEKEDAVDWRATSIAEFRSIAVLPEDSKVHFHISFGAPQIKLLCSREAIVTFKVDEVTFYSSTDFKAAPLLRFTGWEIAVVTEIQHITEDNGAIISCQIDIETARISEALSIFGGFDEADASDEEFTCWSVLLEFFNMHYLHILESAHYHTIYYHDKRTITIEEETVTEGSWTDVTVAGTKGSVSTEVSCWQEIISTSIMYDFHQVITVSQASINEHFNNLWLIGKAAKTVEEVYSLSTWTYQDTFSATFKPMTFRLLTDGRALVFVHLEGGYVKTEEKGSHTHEFGRCRLAFEVDLKMCAHADFKGVSQGWLSKYQSSQAWKHHGGHTDRELRHIYLDFGSADFVHEHSSLKELFGNISARPIANVRAAIHYIKTFYFSKLVEGGLHLLNTVPVWKAGSVAPSYGLTSAIFHVYSETVVTRHNWTHIAAGKEPIIVILGMTNFAPIRDLHLKFSSSWVVRVNNRLTYGVISVARSIFAQERLLEQVARINAATTVIPKFSGVDRDVWDLELTTWENHPLRQKYKCDCVFENGRNGYSMYKWQHRDVWNYEHEGNQYLTNGSYSVSCLTRNYVEIPTTIKNKTLDIKVWGEVKVQMSFKSATLNWSVNCAAKWDSSFDLASEAGGLKLRESGHVAPIIDATVVTGNFGPHALTYSDPHDLLQKALPARVDLQNIFNEFHAFEGIWQYCYPATYGFSLANPAFNAKGDLIFEARPSGLHVPIATTRSVSISGSRATSPRATSFTRTLSAGIRSLSSSVRVGNGAAVASGKDTVVPRMVVPRNGTTVPFDEIVPRNGTAVPFDEIVPRNGTTVPFEEIVPRIGPVKIDEIVPRNGTTIPFDEIVPRIGPVKIDEIVPRIGPVKIDEVVPRIGPVKIDEIVPRNGTTVPFDEIVPRNGTTVPFEEIVPRIGPVKIDEVVPRNGTTVPFDEIVPRIGPVKIDEVVPRIGPVKIDDAPIVSMDGAEIVQDSSSEGFTVNGQAVESVDSVGGSLTVKGQTVVESVSETAEESSVSMAGSTEEVVVTAVA